MPPKERTLQEKEQEKNKILECAISLFQSEGYDAISMRKIAKELKISTTKIYNYFHNRDEIYISIAVESYKLFNSIIESNLLKAKTSDDALECLIKTFFRISQKYEDNYRILFERGLPKYKDYIGTDLENIAVKKKEVGLKFFDLFKRVIKEYMDDHGLGSKYDMDTIALNFFCIIHGNINLQHNKLIKEVIDKPEDYLELTAKRLLVDFENLVL